MQGWELILVAVPYGLALGPMQGFSRTLFGTMLPSGKEGAFFSLYEITDKGSSFVGPLVVGAAAQVSGSMRTAMFYSLFLILFPIYFLGYVNEEEGIYTEKPRHPNVAQR